jgi:hypothetical protein
MRVRCLINRTSQLPGHVRSSVSKTTADEYWDDVDVGATYTVYGLGVSEGVFGYMIDVNNGVSTGSDYPKWFPASFFEILTSKLPSNLHAVYIDKPGLARSFGGIVFRAWAAEPGFLEALIDGDVAATRLWHEAKGEIDLETLPEILQENGEDTNSDES